MYDALADGSFRRRGHLLIVEDNPVNQRVAYLMVERLGYTTDIVEDGALALEAVRKKRYDAVLMDCQMPVMDGYEATQRIRSNTDPSCNIPIIAVTASVLPAERERCFAVGMDEYVPKPIDIETLRSAIERVMTKEPAVDMNEESDVVHVHVDSSPLRQILGDQYEEAMDSFVASAHQRVHEMEESLEDGDMARLQRAAHTLKGSSRSYAMGSLGDAASNLEQAAAGGDRQLVDSAFAEVRTALEAGERKYRESLTYPG